MVCTQFSSSGDQRLSDFSLAPEAISYILALRVGSSELHLLYHTHPPWRGASLGYGYPPEAALVLSPCSPQQTQGWSRKPGRLSKDITRSVSQSGISELAPRGCASLLSFFSLTGL